MKKQEKWAIVKIPCTDRMERAGIAQENDRVEDWQVLQGGLTYEESIAVVGIVAKNHGIEEYVDGSGYLPLFL